METISQILARELECAPEHIDNVINLLDEGNTIPFIARYRKELHGAMDDTTLRTLAERLEYLRNLQQRRDSVKKSIEEQGKLTQELTDAIDAAETLAVLEDLYRPYKQKRRTRATMAKEKGLEPLALALFSQRRDLPEPEELALRYIDEEKGVNSVEDALSGAADIIAEMISDDADIRKNLRPDIHAHLISRNEPRSAQQGKLARQKGVPAVQLRQNTAHKHKEREYPDNMVCRQNQAQRGLGKMLVPDGVQCADDVRGQAVIVAAEGKLYVQRNVGIYPAGADIEKRPLPLVRQKHAQHQAQRLHEHEPPAVSDIVHHFLFLLKKLYTYIILMSIKLLKLLIVM